MFPTSPDLEAAQAALCRLSLYELGRILTKAGELMSSRDGVDRVTGRLLRAQVLVAMGREWDSIRTA